MGAPMNGVTAAELHEHIARLEEENARLRCALDAANDQYRRAAQQLQAIRVIAGTEKD